MKHPRFPPEILELFIDTFNDDPYSNSQCPALRLCSLVSRTFARRARKYLFERVNLRITIGSIDRAEKLYDIMNWTSAECGEGGLTGAAPFIRVFHVDFRCHAPKRAVFRAENTLSAIIQGLHGPEHGVENFSLSYEQDWEIIGLGLRHAVNDLLRSPRLNMLALTGLTRLPTTILVGCHITELTLDSIESSDEIFLYSSRYPSHKSIYPQLQDLSVRLTEAQHVVALLEKDAAPIQAPSITQSALTLLPKVSVSIWCDADYTDLEPLLKRLEKTLERLSIDYGSDAYFEDAVSVDLSKMEKLQEIRLTYDGSEGVFYIDALQAFVSFLALLSAPSSLKTLDLTFIMDHGWGPDDPTLAPLLKALAVPVEEGGWWALNVAISGLSTLREVSITICTMGGEDPESANEFSNHVESLIRTALPHFSGPGTVPELKLTFSVGGVSEDEGDTSDDED